MYKLKNKVLISILTMLLIIFGCCFVNKSDSKVLANDTESISSEKLSALSVKCQVKENTDGSADLRIVSTVDALETYGTAGFDIYVEVEKEDGEKELELLHKYEKPYVTDKIGAKEDGVSFEYNPKVFDTISNYFITVTITGIPESDFGYGFLIKPFVTMSGTPQQYLYGQSRYVKVNDALEGKEYLSIPVVKLDDTTGCSVKVGDTTYSSDAIEFYNNETYDANYTHVRVQMDPSALKSITKVSVLNGEQEVVNTTYRNLYSESIEYDTSWYDNAKEGTTKYVLATKADLLGLSTIVNDTTGKYNEQFLEKTIYLGADLVMNDMTATEMKTAIEDEEVADPLLFNPIGKSVEFAGQFDGQGQTISGIAISESTSNAGLFGCTNASTIIKNLNLRNCYVKGVDNVGSIVGQCGGTFYNVSSDALIDAINNSGGILGNRVSGYKVDMKNCSYSGTLTASTTDSSKNNVGGMIGLLGGNATFEMDKCDFTGKVSTTQSQSGGLIGGIGSKNKITITNCKSTGTVTANGSSAGGYIGYIPSPSSVSITNCLSSASVKANASAVGGFIGLTKKGVTLTNVEFIGNVTGLSQVGGFIGAVNGAISVNVTDGLMSGDIQATESTANADCSVGGICGYITNESAKVTATRCLITGTITYDATTTGCGEQIGNLANGSYTATSVYATTDCCATESKVGTQVGTANITGDRLSKEQLLGDVASANASGLFDESTWTTQVISHPIPKAFHWYYSDTTKTELVINNAIELFEFAKVSQTDNFAGKTVYLGDNIVVNDMTVADMTAEGANPLSWTPIGPTTTNLFAGVFDGQGHTISGIYINSSNTKMQGLFAYVGDNDGDCQIKNFTLDKTYIHGNENTGSIVAAQREKATFENLTSNAVIKGAAKVGGIIGEVQSTVDGTTITNCTFNGSINATGNNSGGMIGLTSGKETDGDFTITLNNCTFGQDGSIEGTQVGGMIGGIGSKYNKVILTSCTSTGTIKAQTGNGIAGGLVGRVAATKQDKDTGTRMNSCTITATLTASEKVGKYVGDIVSSYASYVFLNNIVLTDDDNTY